jgi:predicted DNA-binding protein (UPF0251 family)
MMPACLREENVEIITLLPEEVEAIRLADLLDLEQEEIAQRMGVSRKTAWKDLHSARKKIADAVINGKALHMESCGSADNCECRFVTLNEECADKKCRKRQHGTETGENTMP